MMSAQQMQEHYQQQVQNQQALQQQLKHSNDLIADQAAALKSIQGKLRSQRLANKKLG